MGDAALVWRDLREERQQQNAMRYALSVAQRDRYPYRVEQFNHGTHWRVEMNGQRFDFWPHTGKFMATPGRGVKPWGGVAHHFADFIERITEHTS